MFLHKLRMFAFFELLFGFLLESMIELKFWLTLCCIAKGLASFVDLSLNTWLEFVELAIDRSRSFL